MREKQRQVSTLPKNLQEIIEKGRTDPVIFITKLLGMPLHSGQRRYLNVVKERHYRKYVLTPANRWGKSTLIACLQLWYLFYKHGIRPGNSGAWYKAEYRTANIAPHSALTEPVFKTISSIMSSRFPINTPDGRVVNNVCLIEFFYLPEKTLNTPPYKQYFANNSYIEHRSLANDSGDALQGKPFGLITYDEGGRSNRLEEEINGNIMPRLFDWRGDFHLLSTPDQNSASILYHYQLYEDGRMGLNQTYTQEGSLKDNEFFSLEQIQEQYELFKNDPLKDQVLDGKFIFAGATIYPVIDITAAQDESLNDGVKRLDGHTYKIGIDTAMSTDEMVFTILDDTNHDEIITVRQSAKKGNAQSFQLHMQDLIDLYDLYKEPGKDNIRILLETWNGESARFYQDMPYYMQQVTSCYGSWQPETVTSDNKNPIKKKNKDIKKADILLALRKLLSERRLKIPKEKVLGQQLAIYREDDAKIPTDRVISLALAAYLADETAKQPKTVVWQSISW